MAGRSARTIVARQPLAKDTPARPTIGRHLRSILRRNPGKVPFTAMWTPPRVRAQLNKAYAQKSAARKVEVQQAPDRAWRREFLRSELRRLRPIVREQSRVSGIQQGRLTYKQVWRLSLTADPS